jgi:hypothetical protein
VKTQSWFIKHCLINCSEGLRNPKNLRITYVWTEIRTRDLKYNIGMLTATFDVLESGSNRYLSR